MGQNNPTGAGGAANGPVTLGHVIKLEAREIGRRRGAFGLGPRTKENLAGEGPTGLSLSGGGIRSACFNLGFLEGLDRRPSDPGKPDGPNCLECFDYVSSVSGGSYAAGHLATAMLEPTPRSGRKGEWLGNVQLTSKTVPGWTWGLGVWFLGVVFQLLKTGTLLVAALAALAFAMRMLDAPDAANFCATMGLASDVARGFVPFWMTLWAFLVGYCINSSFRRGRALARWWFGYFVVVSVLYTVALWWWEPDGAAMEGLSFERQYAFMAALVGPPVGACAAIGAWRLIGSFRPARVVRPEPADPCEEGRDAVTGPTLKHSLLAPILVALFCFAALVTTGDIGLDAPGSEAGAASAQQDRARWYGEQGDRIYYLACAALSVISIGLLSPPGLFRNALFKSARRVEEYDAAGARRRGGASRRGWEPIFRVVVFLCSYGFVLLVIFVVFGTVARENVSGFYDWRTDLPSTAFHLTELRDADPAWERVERDARARGGPWKRLAERFLQARENVGFPLDADRELAAQIRLLDSTPWINRMLWPISWAWARAPWNVEGYSLRPSPVELHEKIARQGWGQRRLAAEISRSVLGDPWLYTIIPLTAVSPDPSETPARWDPARYEGLGERYRRRARSLAALRFPGLPLLPIDPSLEEDPFPSPDDGAEAVGPIGPAAGGPSLDADIRNNNRRALHLYFPGLLRDRRDKEVFSSIVWTEDQWTRLSIAATALVVWLLCCVVDVNTYALQKFYRGHVIDSWVRIEPGKRPHRWLHQTRSGYRGWEFGPSGRAGARVRRAPLPLINATLEGNRSLGHEPELPRHIFTFSPVAAGSGGEEYWIARMEGGRKTEDFTRRNRLDIGNMVAISGAFLSPGTIANPALSAVLHLLNIQTGYWVCKPDESERHKRFQAMRFHACQSLGIDWDGDSRLMLTDGAHVENLGLYPLLRRRCRLIVVSDCGQEDAGAPPERRFDALIQVLQQAAIDGVEVGPFLNSRAYRHWLATGEILVDGRERDGCRHPRASGLDLVRPPDAKPAPASAGGGGFLARLLGLGSPKPEADAAKGTDVAVAKGTNGDADAAAKETGAAAKGADQGEAAAGPAFAQEHYLFAWIRYPDESKPRGLLVYLRPTLTGDEGDTLLHGALHSQFPDDDPIDQFYTPARMNTYRLLGRHIADDLMDDKVMRGVIAAILNGGEIVPKVTREPGRPRPDPCRDDCGAGPRCSAGLPRSVRLELLAAASPRNGNDGDGNGEPAPPGPRRRSLKPGRTGGRGGASPSA